MASIDDIQDNVDSLVLAVFDAVRSHDEFVAISKPPATMQPSTNEQTLEKSSVSGDSFICGKLLLNHHSCLTPL